jgi:hypothetical protein
MFAAVLAQATDEPSDHQCGNQNAMITPVLTST